MNRREFRLSRRYFVGVAIGGVLALALGTAALGVGLSNRAIEPERRALFLLGAVILMSGAAYYFFHLLLGQKRGLVLTADGVGYLWSRDARQFLAWNELGGMRDRALLGQVELLDRNGRARLMISHFAIGIDELLEHLFGRLPAPSAAPLPRTFRATLIRFAAVAILVTTITAAVLIALAGFHVSLVPLSAVLAGLAVLLSYFSSVRRLDVSRDGLVLTRWFRSRRYPLSDIESVAFRLIAPVEELPLKRLDLAAHFRDGTVRSLHVPFCDLVEIYSCIRLAGAPGSRSVSSVAAGGS
jgi:hypothetical protein